jgi:hypothetical protein
MTCDRIILAEPGLRAASHIQFSLICSSFLRFRAITCRSAMVIGKFATVLVITVLLLILHTIFETENL